MDPAVPGGLARVGFPSLLAWPLDCLIRLMIKSGRFATTTDVYSNALAYVGWHEEFGKGGSRLVFGNDQLEKPHTDVRYCLVFANVSGW